MWKLIFCRLAEDDQLYKQHFWWRVSSKSCIKLLKKLYGFPKYVQHVFNIKFSTDHCRITTRLTTLYLYICQISITNLITSRPVNRRMITRCTTVIENPPEKRCVHSARVYILRWAEAFAFTIPPLFPIQASLSLSDTVLQTQDAKQKSYTDLGGWWEGGGQCQRKGSFPWSQPRLVFWCCAFLRFWKGG